MIKQLWKNYPIIQSFYIQYSRLINSWIPVVGVVFIVFAFSVILIDDFSIPSDDLWSIGDAGFFTLSQSPLTVINNIRENSRAMVPGYFFILSIWANMVGWSPTVLRVLSIYFGILSLSLMYRFGRDYISKEAGLYAAIMLGSLTYYNIWYLIIRMYTFYVFGELLVLWLYFRIVSTTQSISIKHYIGLILSSLLFINSQFFSAIIFFAVGIYHLLMVPKTKKWLYISVSFVIAGLIFSPWLLVLKEGFNLATGPQRNNLTSIALNFDDLFSLILHLGVNGNIIFLVVMILSLKDIRRNKITMALWVLTVVTITTYIMVNEVTHSINQDRIRYLLLAFPLIIFLVVKGILIFDLWKIVTVSLVVFWIASGLLFHRRIGYSQYNRAFNSFPMHLVERHLSNSFQDNDILMGFSSGVSYDFETAYGKIIDFYFRDYAIITNFLHTDILRHMDDIELQNHLQAAYENHQRIWFVYENNESKDYIKNYQTILKNNYIQCFVDGTLTHITIELYQTQSCSNN